MRESPTRPGSGDDDTDAPEEIVMFFLGPDGEFVDEDPSLTPQRTLADVARAWRATLEREHVADPYGRNRHGPRPVQGTGRPGRPGYRDEILVTLATAPEVAVVRAVQGDVFDSPISRLVVDEASLVSRRYELTWNATVQVWKWRNRAVRLRLYASPSLNVAVLSLTPPQQRAAARSRFLAVGLACLTELRDRIDATSPT